MSMKNLKKSVFAMLGIVLIFTMISCNSKPSNDDSSDDYLRCNATSKGDMAEIESGFYYNFNGRLYYADRTNINQWVPVCNKPDCKHEKSSSECYSIINNEMIQKEENLYYYDYSEKSIIKVAQDGSEPKKILTLPLSVSEIGSSSSRSILYPDCFVMYYSYLTEKGMYKQSFARVDEKGELHEVFSFESDTNIGHLTLPAYHAGVRGEFALVSSLLVEEKEDTYNVLFRLDDEKDTLERVNLPENISILYSYLAEDTFTYYKQNEGFFQIDLNTGTETALFQNQLENARGYALSENYLVEYNRYDDYTPKEAFLRFYDGTTWIDVQLPDTIKKGNYLFIPVSVASDRVFFEYFPRDNSGYQLYYFMLDGAESNPELTLCATFGDESVFETILSTENNEVSALQKVDVTVFDTEEYLVKVTEVGFDIEKPEYYHIKTYCENKTADKTFTINLNRLTIDGIQCGLSSCVTVKPNETVEHIAINSKGAFEKSGVDCNKEFTSIQLLSYVTEEGKEIVYHPDTGSDVDTSIVSIYPYGEDKETIAVREPLSTDKVIIDNEYVKLTAIEYWGAENKNGTVRYVMENKTDKIIGFYLTLVSINNIPLNVNYTDFYQTSCLPKSQHYHSFEMFDDMRIKNNIEIEMLEEYEVILEISYVDVFEGRIGEPILKEKISIKK